MGSSLEHARGGRWAGCGWLTWQGWGQKAQTRPPPDVSCVQAGRAQMAGVKVVQSESLGSEGLVVQPLQLRWELS